MGSDVLFNTSYNKKDLALTFRKAFNDLEFTYEKELKNRFDSLDAPELKEPERKEVVRKVVKRNGGKEKKEKTAAKAKKSRKAKKAKTPEAK